MKKFINDNLWWMMIIAIALGGFAVYKIYSNNKVEDSTDTKTDGVSN